MPSSGLSSTPLWPSQYLLCFFARVCVFCPLLEKELGASLTPAQSPANTISNCNC